MCMFDAWNLQFWRKFQHWLHRKLSERQFPVQPVMEISSKLNFRCSHKCVKATQTTRDWTIYSAAFQAINKELIETLHYWPFVRGIRRWPADSPQKEPVMPKSFHVLASQWRNTSTLTACLVKNTLASSSLLPPREYRSHNIAEKHAKMEGSSDLARISTVFIVKSLPLLILTSNWKSSHINLYIQFNPPTNKLINNDSQSSQR